VQLLDSAANRACCGVKSYVIICLKNRFHVAVRLFSNGSQMTSKRGKNKKVANEAQPSVSLMLLPYVDVRCDLLGSLSRDDVGDSENVIRKWNFVFLQ